MSVVVGNQFH